jgi:hypothetical protein
MPNSVLFLAMVLAQSATSPILQRDTARSATKTDASISSEVTVKLLSARRIFVDDFGESSASKTLRSMVIDAVRKSNRLIVTENRDKADLILRGAALDKTTQEFHALGSSTAVASAAGGHSASVTGTPYHVSGSSSGGFGAAAAAIDDAQASTETINDARVSVRLVSNDGDVVWSTTQESKGAKYKSATADVADKVVKQLLRDLDKANGTR